MTLIKALVTAILYLAASPVFGAFQIKAGEPLSALHAPTTSHAPAVKNGTVLVAQRQPQAEQIKGRFIARYGGKGLAGVSVSLYDAQRTLMDVTESDADGFFILDLGVYDSVERKVIAASYLEVVDVKGRKTRVTLSEVIRSYARIIELKDIPLP